MKNIIYYFTATGNSLVCAKNLAKYLDGETELRAAANYLEAEEITVEPCDTLGFVFPVYGERAPWPVYHLAARLKLSGQPYVFGIATCNDRGGSCLDFFASWLKKHGIEMNYTRKITMPGNCMATNDAENAERIADCDMFCHRSADNINSRFQSTVEGFDAPENTEEGQRERFPKIFVFKSDPDKCVSCGLCAQVCPMKNITMTDGHPVYGSTCASCMACFHWCPAEAVYIDSRFFNNGRSRYHHPDVTADEIAAQQKRF